ncbi:MAG: hypothetical protein OXR73_36080 [Myxococcales bacterium]|nr:hypothetical protein [Myxococcales bacterium]
MMRRLAASPVAAHFFHVLATSIALIALAARIGAAQGTSASGTGPYFEAGPPLVRAYEVRLSAFVHYANRTDFSRPLLLFRHRVESLEALSLTTQVDLRLALAEGLALHAIAPVTFRSVDTRIDGVLISETTQLPDREFQLRGVGLSDATLALAYDVTALEPLGIFVDLGARIPIDDNPGDNTFPSRMPPSTGQGEVFAGLGARLPAARAPDGKAPWGVSLGYRLSYRPEATTTYLVRVVGNQSYASGTLASRTAHGLVGRVSYRMLQALELSLSPRLTMDETAQVVAFDTPEQVVPETWLWQLNLRAGLRLYLSEHHALELSYQQPLFDTWRIDPLFPLAMPEQGWGLSWIVSGT